jgi:hypothetical protein
MTICSKNDQYRGKEQKLNKLTKKSDVTQAAKTIPARESSVYLERDRESLYFYPHRKRESLYIYIHIYIYIDRGPTHSETHIYEHRERKSLYIYPSIFYYI